MFRELERSGEKPKTPISDVVRLCRWRLLIAGGVRVGSDVLYALVYVFTLTYVTSVLKLSRTLPLTAVLIPTPINATTISSFAALSNPIGQRERSCSPAEPDEIFGPALPASAARKCKWTPRTKIV
jgi:hypothetical protein